MTDLEAALGLFREWQTLIARRQTAVADLDRAISEVERRIIALGPLSGASLGANENAPPVPGSLNDAGVRDYLLEKIRQGGPLDYAVLARDLYGEDNRKNRKRLQQKLIYLSKKLHLIRNKAYRYWEIRG